MLQHIRLRSSWLLDHTVLLFLPLSLALLIHVALVSAVLKGQKSRTVSR
jgi:hypothetical protein